MIAHPMAAAFLEGCDRGLATTGGDARDMLRRQITTALNGIHGVSRMHVTFRGLLGRTPRPALVIAMEGWSPSLHRLSMSHLQPLGIASDAVQSVRPVLNDLATVIGRLAARADAAAALGFPKPLDPTGETEVDHLHMDSSLAELASAPGRSRHGGARGAVRRLHGGRNGACACWSHVSDNDHSIVERIAGPGVIRDVGWRAHDGGLGDGLPSYDGKVLSLKAEPMPDLIMAALPGRRLDDMVRVHPALDHRVIRSIHVDDLGGDDRLYSMTFEHDHVPLRSLKD